MDFKSIIKKITPRKYWFLRRYLIALPCVLLWTIIVAIIHWYAQTPTTNTVLSIFTLILTLMLIWTPIAIIAYIIAILNNKYEAEKREKKNKELEELQLSIREMLNSWIYVKQEWLDIYLPDDEFCLNVYWVVIYKTKTHTKNIYYSWLRYRVRIAKWLSYTVWNINPARETIETKYIDDKWILYLTNKRIIVKLEKKVENIPYDKLLYVEMIPWWVVLYKQTWKPLEYKFIKEYDNFPIYISEILNAQKETKKPKKKNEVIEEEIEE